MKTRDIINILEKKFPKINAEEWDNVGLLIGDYDKEIKKIQKYLDKNDRITDNIEFQKIVNKKTYERLKDLINYDGGKR